MNAPNVNNLSLGRGELFFNALIDDVYQGEKSLGNAPAITITPEIEELEHVSSLEGLNKVDVKIVTSLKLIVTAKLEEFNQDNIEMIFLGEKTTIEQTADSVTDEEHTVKEFDAYYKLEYRKVSSVVVKDSTGVTTYTEDDDYEVDAKIGRVKILSGGSGGIEADDVLKISYSYADLELPAVKLAEKTKVEGSIRFLGDPAYGPEFELYIPKASVSADGEMPLISTEWASMGIRAEALIETDTEVLMIDHTGITY